VREALKKVLADENLF